MSGIDLRGETEQSLVKAIQQGKQEVLGLLYDAYAPVMMGVITRIIPDKEVAEEVLHETFVAIWSRIGIYDSSKNRLLIWGLAIARGIALEALKTGKYKPESTEEKETCLPEEKSLRDMVLQDIQQESKLFKCLKEQERTILDLIYLQGKSCAEVTDELGISEETLKSSLKKAFIHLKAEKSA